MIVFIVVFVILFTVKLLSYVTVKFFQILIENTYRQFYRQTETHPIDTPQYISTDNYYLIQLFIVFFRLI